MKERFSEIYASACEVIKTTKMNVFFFFFFFLGHKFAGSF